MLLKFSINVSAYMHISEYKETKLACMKSYLLNVIKTDMS